MSDRSPDNSGGHSAASAPFEWERLTEFPKLATNLYDNDDKGAATTTNMNAPASQEEAEAARDEAARTMIMLSLGRRNGDRQDQSSNPSGLLEHWVLRNYGSVYVLGEGRKPLLEWAKAEDRGQLMLPKVEEGARAEADEGDWIAFLETAERIEREKERRRMFEAMGVEMSRYDLVDLESRWRYPQAKVAKEWELDWYVAEDAVKRGGGVLKKIEDEVEVRELDWYLGEDKDDAKKWLWWFAEE